MTVSLISQLFYFPREQNWVKYILSREHKITDFTQTSSLHKIFDFIFAVWNGKVALYFPVIWLSTFQGQNLSREEEEKRRVRRERNKVAATKCREKRKAHSVYVRHEYGKVFYTPLFNKKKYYFTFSVTLFTFLFLLRWQIRLNSSRTRYPLWEEKGTSWWES